MKRILNKRNLIFIIMLALLLIMIPVESFAASGGTVSINRYLNKRLSDWYLILRSVVIAVMLILLLIIGIKAALKNNAADKALLKRMLGDWIVGMFLVIFMHYIMIALITLNENAVKGAESLGQKISGMEEGQEISLYESAISKAYEIKFTSGTIGMVLYIMLVVYTYKFVLVYLKRYVNVVVLILLGPIVSGMYAFKKVLSGKTTVLKSWFKEFIYNVFLQAFHALIYGSLVGLTLRFSREGESFVGAILTLIIFHFAFKLDKLLRKLFNAVGGSTAIQVSAASEFASDVKGVMGSAAKGVASGISVSPNQGGGIAVSADFTNAKNALSSGKNDVLNKYKGRFDDKVQDLKDKTKANLSPENLKRDATEINKLISGEYKEVSDEAIAKEQKKIDEAGFFGKGLNKLQGVIVNLPGNTKKKIEELERKLERKKKEVVNYVTDLQSDVRAIKSIPSVIRKAKSIPASLRNINFNRNQNTTVDALPAEAVVPMLEENYDAIVDVDVDIDALTSRLKMLVDMSVDEVASAVVVAAGYQSILAQPRLGMMYLAQENYKAMMHIENPESERRTVKAASRRAKRSYKFKRFGNGSIRTIEKAVTDSFVSSNAYMRTVGRVTKSQGVKEIRFKNVEGPLETIKYKAKAGATSRLHTKATIALASMHSFREDTKWAVSINLMNAYEQATRKTTMDSFSEEELRAMQASGRIIRVNGGSPEQSGYIIANPIPAETEVGQRVNEFLMNNPENPMARKINDLLAISPENESVFQLSNYVIQNPESPVAQIFEFIDVTDEGKVVVHAPKEAVQENALLFEQLIGQMSQGNETRKTELESILAQVTTVEPMSDIQSVQMRVPIAVDRIMTGDIIPVPEMVNNVGQFMQESTETPVVEKITELLQENPNNMEVLRVCDYVVRNPESSVAQVFENITVDEEGQLIVELDEEAMEDASDPLGEILKEYIKHEQAQKGLDEVIDLVRVDPEIQSEVGFVVEDDTVDISLDSLLDEITEASAQDRLDQMLSQVIVDAPEEELLYEVVYAETASKAESKALSFEEESGTISSNKTFEELIASMSTTTSEDSDDTSPLDYIDVEYESERRTAVVETTDDKRATFDALMERLTVDTSLTNDSDVINAEFVEVEDEPKKDFEELMEMITDKEKVPAKPKAKEKQKQLRITTNEQKEEKDTERLVSFYIYGEVNKPGRYLIKYGTKVYQAINEQAGGFTKLADKDAIKDKLNDVIDEKITGISIPKKLVTEEDKKKTKKKDKKQEKTNDGETKETANTISCYIMGAVRNPGEKHIKKGSKVINLIELAGGYTDEVNLNKLPPLYDELKDGIVVVIPKRTVEDEYADRGISLKKIEDTILQEYERYKKRIGITLKDIERGKKHREYVISKIKQELAKENIKLSDEELEKRMDEFILKQKETSRKTQGKGKFVSDASVEEHKSQIDLIKDMLSKQFTEERTVKIEAAPSTPKEEKRAQIMEQLREIINLGV